MMARREQQENQDGPNGGGNAKPRPRRRRRPAELTLLRPIPGTSALHRLWAGTKLVLLVVVALMIGFDPTWPAIGAAAAVVALGIAIARIPRGAVPRLPRWLWIGFALGALDTLRSSAQPVGHLAGIAVSWGGLGDWARITALAVVVFAGAALVSWTTPLADVAPALARLGTPLRWLRLPVDEWAGTIALSMRCLPLLIDEVRTLTAARRLRPAARAEKESRMNWLAREFQDLLFTSVAVSLRRAGELGEAMEARGGFGAVSDSVSQPGWRDALAVALVAGVVVAVFLT
jgi:energy-coupling factor transporter transmembrane protein EcfT